MLLLHILSYAHLKDIRRSWPVQLRNNIIAHTTQFSLALPKHVRPLLPNEPPIPGVTIHNGWKCFECQHCCPSQGSIVEHCKQEHKWTKAKGPIWKAVSIQTFFVGSRRNFFEVDYRQQTKEERGSKADLSNAIQLLLERGQQQDEHEAKEAARADNDQPAVDNTPWMRKTR